MFSACGGIRTGNIMSVLTAYFPMLALDVFDKGWIVSGLTGLTGSSTRSGTGCTDLQLIGSSVTDCQNTDLTLVWPT